MAKPTKSEKLNQPLRRALTPKQKAELAALSSLPDDQIDTSDIPELPRRAWKHAARGKFLAPVKRD